MSLLANNGFLYSFLFLLLFVKSPTEFSLPFLGSVVKGLLQITIVLHLDRLLLLLDVLNDDIRLHLASGW